VYLELDLVGVLVILDLVDEDPLRILWVQAYEGAQVACGVRLGGISGGRKHIGRGVCLAVLHEVCVVGAALLHGELDLVCMYVCVCVG
jgi:hypothetical protein